MSVVDRRASFVSHGGRSSWRHSVGPTTVLSDRRGSLRHGTRNSLPGGAFHGHSMRDLSGDIAGGNHIGGKRPGLTTEGARELSMSRRSLGGSARSQDLGSSTRRSRMSINYGAASVKRLDEDLDIEAADSSSLADSVRSRRASSRSAGEGLFLVKAQSQKENKSAIQIIQKKDSNQLVPNSHGPVELDTRARSQNGLLKTSKSVKFSSVSIQYHNTVLGNNPFVSSGPPLELSWEHDPSEMVSNMPIDRYEEIRAPQRRGEWDLALSRGERESQLLELGCTREEIAAAVRETSRVKAQRANTVMNLNMAGIEEFTEGVRRRGTEVIGLRKSSNWMYNDWKRGSYTYAHAHFSTRRAEATAVQASVVPHSPSSLGRSPEHEKKSPYLLDVIQKVTRRREGPTDDAWDSGSIGDQPEHVKEYDGPAFGIRRKSFSSGVTFSDDAGNTVLWPFAVIKIVHPGSPADEAGLRRGDRIVKLGNITSFNHDHCKAIPVIGQVAATKEVPISAVIENQYGARRTVTIHPHTWSGRGHFGFLFREIVDDGSRSTSC